MHTREIAKKLKLTAQLMELHNENPFKIKSLGNAAYKLDKTGIDMENMVLEEIEKIEGVGKSIAQKIHLLQTTGELPELSHLLSITPEGVIEMMSVKGIGPKKVASIWKELGIESIGELLYACNENRLVALKGFGLKTQQQITESIEYAMSNDGKFLYAAAQETALRFIEFLNAGSDISKISLSGAIRRKCEIIEKIEVLIASDKQPDISGFENIQNIPLEIILCSVDDFYNKLFETTANAGHLNLLKEIGLDLSVSFASEENIYNSLNLQYIEPELREGFQEIDLAKRQQIPRLIEFTDLKGTLHNHTTYSDGLHSLKDMALHCKVLGYEYLGICDHSQSAYYANGLKTDRILEQQKEIDLLNIELSPFRIFKGIESDILNDGSLDYPEEILKTFDFVVASIHSNLKMSLEKSMMRLLKAIENPYTTILGHMTGRLLLSREGYPVDHKKIIDACAENKVIIELNAHPRRLDIDWQWIPYCLEKGVKIAINPDAHHKGGYFDMSYGTCAARKGMLTKEMCFNTLSLSEMEQFFLKKVEERG